MDVSSGIIFGLRVSGGIGGGVGLEILFGRRDIYFGIIVGGLGGMRLLCWLVYTFVVVVGGFDRDKILFSFKITIPSAVWDNIYGK